VSQFVDQAVVLKTRKLSESDKILTLLTYSHGKLQAVARGSRRANSSFGAKVANFTFITASVARGKSLDILTQVRINQSFFEALSISLDKFTQASLICNFTDQIVSESYISQPSTFLLLKKAIVRISNTNFSKVAADLYLIQFLWLMGYGIDSATYKNDFLQLYIDDNFAAIIKLDKNEQNRVSQIINYHISQLPIL
jgi:DNA repair protein RecO (recombination protein O)